MIFSYFFLGDCHFDNIFDVYKYLFTKDKLHFISFEQIMLKKEVNFDVKAIQD